MDTKIGIRYCCRLLFLMENRIQNYVTLISLSDRKNGIWIKLLNDFHYWIHAIPRRSILDITYFFSTQLSICIIQLRNLHIFLLSIISNLECTRWSSNYWMSLTLIPDILSRTKKETKNWLTDNYRNFAKLLCRTHLTILY